MVWWISVAFASGGVGDFTPAAQPAAGALASPAWAAESVPLVAPGAESSDPGSARVWNGSEAGDGQYMATVALFAASTRAYGGVFCSGTLIHPEWVLTAAHCLDGVGEYERAGLALYVGIGTQAFRRNQGLSFQDYEAWEGYQLHPDYDRREGAGAGFDIGLIKLSAPMAGVPVIPLNTTPIDSSWLGESLELVGWGVTNDGAQDSGRKRWTSLPLWDLSSDMVYAYDGTNNPYWGGGANGTTNLCQGDSGGSTYIRTEGGLAVAGVNAIVFPRCANGGTGSTRVDAYADWVFDVLGEEGATPGEGGGPGGGGGQGGASAALPDYTMDAPSPGGPIDAPVRAAPAAPEATGCQQAPGSGGVWWLWLGAWGIGLFARRSRFRG